MTVEETAGAQTDDVGTVEEGPLASVLAECGKDAQRIILTARTGALTDALIDRYAFKAMTFGFPGADEMGNMFQVYRDFEKEVLGARSADTTRQLNPQAQSFDQFIAKNKSKIQAATQPAPAAKA